MSRAAWSFAVAATAFAVSARPVPATALEPYQMVRSLQLVQDRLANGDQAAMPMQRKLLELTDARLAAARSYEFDDKKNFRALFIYAMSGGNPATVRMLISKLDLEGEKAALGQGILSYMAGDYATTRDRLEGVAPLNLPPELGAFVGLIRGAVLVEENPGEALRLFDDARLLAPGTLVEEAALRRSIAVAATVGDLKRFARASSQYVRRFLHSPYASQFAEAFVSSVVTLHDRIDLDTVAEIVSDMDTERAHTIYLRLARQSAIDGYKPLLTFASKKARETQSADMVEEDPRSLLYSTVASVTSENVAEVKKKLAHIDPSRLSGSDQELLEAARRVAEQVLARPIIQDIASAEPQVETMEPPAAPAQATPASASEAGAAASPASGGEPAGDNADAPAGESVQTAAAGPSGTTGVSSFVEATRDRLAEIDKLLEETGQ